MESVVEVMRIKRLPPMGKLVVEIGGQQYEQLSKIQDDTLKQLVTAAIGELIVFSDGYQTLVDAGVAPPIINRNSGSESGQDTSVSERQAAFQAALEGQRLSAMAGEANLAPVVDSPQPAPEPLDSTQIEDELDIAGQVDVFLQKQIMEDPELRGRSIHIVGDPSGSLSIHVDGKSYSSPAAIADPSVRSAIKSALREWDGGNSSS